MRIGRYDNPQLCVSYRDIETDVSRESVALLAADGGASGGILYTKGEHRTVVCFMHPRADMSRHYAIPALLHAGYAAFGQNSRWLNNDETCVHETLLLDVAAGIAFLRSRGFEHVILVGNSGGGSLYTFYLAQASLAPPERLQRTPAGDSTGLGNAELPTADALVLLGAHLGEGHILMHMIDPSVTDEADPLSCDSNLDPFDPANGYRDPPESSRYASEFVTRYRQAQKARVERLDALARAHLQRRREARQVMKDPAFAARPWCERAPVLRAGALGPYMIVYRTEADLRAFDLSLDPSDRDAGTLFSYRPDLTNYMEFGFARVCTPRSWLSTWSGITSNASILRAGPQVRVPALVVGYSGDNAIFPSDARAAFEALGSRDKGLVQAPGDHYGFTVGTQERAGASVALKHVIGWLRERYPA